MMTSWKMTSLLVAVFFLLTVVSRVLIKEIYIGSGVSIFSQRGSLLCFLLVLYVYLIL